MAATGTPIQKVPPPVSYIGETVPSKPTDKSMKVRITNEFNRWLLTLTAFVNAEGFINGNVVDLTTNASFEQVVTEVNTLSGDVSTLQGDVTTINGQISTINGEIGTINGEITTINNEIAAIPIVRNGTAAPAGGLGNVNDWFADTVNKHIYVKTGVTTWTEIV